MDLQLITNNNLRKLFCKKSKYREPTSINFYDAKTSIGLKREAFTELSECKSSLTMLLEEIIQT